MPGITVGTQDISVNKAKEDSSLQGAYILAGRRQEIIDILNKQIVCYISGGDRGYRKQVSPCHRRSGFPTNERKGKDPQEELF